MSHIRIVLFGRDHRDRRARKSASDRRGQVDPHPRDACTAAGRVVGEGRDRRPPVGGEAASLVGRHPREPHLDPASRHRLHRAVRPRWPPPRRATCSPTRASPSTWLSCGGCSRPPPGPTTASAPLWWRRRWTSIRGTLLAGNLVQPVGRAGAGRARDPARRVVHRGRAARRTDSATTRPRARWRSAPSSSTSAPRAPGRSCSSRWSGPGRGGRGAHGLRPAPRGHARPGRRRAVSAAAEPIYARLLARDDDDSSGHRPGRAARCCCGSSGSASKAGPASWCRSRTRGSRRSRPGSSP